MFEVVIVGAGPAGLSAALSLGRVHRSVLVLDSGSGRNAPAAAVHNFVTRDGVAPAEFRAIGRAQLASYPTVEVRDAEAVDVEPFADGHGFTVRTADGAEYPASRLLLASGMVDRLPSIPGLAPLWGLSAFHCPYCHGFEISGQSIAVLGGDPDRIRLALHLSRFSSDVVLCTNGPADLASPAAQVLSRAGVTVRCEPITGFEATGPKLDAINFAEGPVLPRNVVFVKSAPAQRSPLTSLLGCGVFPDATVEVSEFHQTSVPGVYAAGDMARRATVPIPFSAVIAAASAGTVAAGAIDQDLLSADFDLPNPFAVRER